MDDMLTKYSGFTTEIAVWVPPPGGDIDVYVSPEVCQGHKITAPAPCRLILPWCPIPETTITATYTKSFEIIGAGGDPTGGATTSTITTVITVTVTTDSISYANVQVTDGQGAGMFIPSPVIPIPPIVVPLTGPDGVIESRTASFSPWQPPRGGTKPGQSFPLPSGGPWVKNTKTGLSSSRSTTGKGDETSSTTRKRPTSNPLQSTSLPSPPGPPPGISLPPLPPTGPLPTTTTSSSTTVIPVPVFLTWPPEASIVPVEDPDPEKDNEFHCAQIFFITVSGEAPHLHALTLTRYIRSASESTTW